MPSVSLSPPPKLQFFGTDGNPLVGGKVYTYAAGTTTPLATYVDSAGVTVNTNPIILDTRGEANIWFSSAAYKFVLRTATDTLIWTVDNITNGQYLIDLLANTTDPAKGDALVGFRQSNSSGNLSGAVGRTVHQKLQETISVKDFGATGDGTTDDTAAIQAAVNTAPATGGCIYFPIGKYLITSAITWSGKNALKLYGDRAGLDSTNTAVEIICGTIGIAMFDGRNSLHSHIEGFLLNGNSKATYGIRLGIAATHDQFVQIRDVVVSSCTQAPGIGLSLSYNSNGAGSVADSAFYNMYLAGNIIGVDNYAQDNNFYDCSVSGNTTCGLNINSFSQSNWFGGIFSGNAVDLLLVSAATAQLQSMTSVWFENSTNSIVNAAGTAGTCAFNFSGSPALNTASTTALMDFTSVNGTVTIISGTNYPVGASSSTIKTNANGSYVCLNYSEGSNIPFTFTGTGKVYNLRASKWTVNNLTVSNATDGLLYLDRAAGNNTLLGYTVGGTVEYNAGVRYDMGGDWALFYSDGTIARRYPNSYKTTEAYDTAVPTTGTWTRGSIVWNVTPSAGGTPGWMCVTAGTPGTWKAMANLAA